MLGLLCMASCASAPRSHVPGPLEGRVICLDPGHGGTAKTDHFRVGPTGEREEWINLQVGLHLKEMLEERGARVIMTRTEDVPVGLKERALLAVDGKADAFLSLHHNATADPGVNFPIIYFHGNASENQASVALAKCVGKRIREALFNGEGPVSIVSDYTIFPGGGTAVLRHSYGIPGAIGEASFFTCPEEEQRLKNDQYNRFEAKAYVKALEDFFSEPTPPIGEKFSLVKVPPFPVFQEADRKKPEAKLWREDFEKGEHLMKEGDRASLEKALFHLDRSARSFPDSPVARKCHEHRARVLELLDRPDDAAGEKNRVKEFYISFP